MARFEPTATDLEQLSDRGISVAELHRQLDCFARGFPALDLRRPAVLGDGIVRLEESDHARLLELWAKAATTGRLSKWVPASGAASRMFKPLAARLSRPDPLLGREGEEDDVLRFLDEVESFAFADTLKRACGGDWPTGDQRELLRVLLETLDFATIPKGLIPFHLYEDGARTAFEEHLPEARATVGDARDVSRVHFTVAPEWRARIEEHVRCAASRFDGNFEVDYSEQAASTDTVAVDLNGTPLRDAAGRLVFRPGGHGALLHNLDAFDGDIVFVKNIDNVTTESRRAETILYKKLLAGLLLELQTEAHRLWFRLDETEEAVNEAEHFLHEKLLRTLPASARSVEERRDFLRDALARPMRVCGMVRNEGEPGGGPFWVGHADGSESLQVVESSQVAHDDPEQEKQFRSSTHFNPVDLVCGLRGPDGRSLPLHDFVDTETGFIAEKSMDGAALKALERPGLWNGAMAHWLTVFVEVPLSTFSPVKTVLDLLREAHR